MKKQFYLILCLLIISCSSVDDIDVIENGDLFSKEARVVGYYSHGSFSLNDKIQYCKLTHLNIAFANPRSDGTIALNQKSQQQFLKNVMDTARSQNSNIKIYISIGGGWLSDEIANIYKNSLANPQDRLMLIDKIVSYVLDNGFDGVDVDLEWKYVTTGYSDFVIELSDALKEQSKGITAAYPSETRYSLINEEALNALDFINLMVYDYTGPWNPSPGQHSSHNHAKRGIHFWKNKVGINPSKLTLGVPFYGYDFQNSTTVESFTYGSMVDSDVSNSEKDNVGNKYYNGRPTIANKVKLASQNLSGIMIWRLGADSFSEYSLLETIHKTYTDLGVETTGLCGN